MRRDVWMVENPQELVPASLRAAHRQFRHRVDSLWVAEDGFEPRFQRRPFARRQFPRA